MPRKEKKCPDCLDKGYLSLLGRRGAPREIVACDCRHGRQFLKLMREQSPPAKRKPSPVDSDRTTDDDVAAQVQHDKSHGGAARVHEGD